MHRARLCSAPNRPLTARGGDHSRLINQEGHVDVKTGGRDCRPPVFWPSQRAVWASDAPRQEQQPRRSSARSSVRDAACHRGRPRCRGGLVATFRQVRTCAQTVAMPLMWDRQSTCRHARRAATASGTRSPGEVASTTRTPTAPDTPHWALVIARGIANVLLVVRRGGAGGVIMGWSFSCADAARDRARLA